MLPAPFSSSGKPEPKYVILTRGGGARTRRDALGNVTNLPSGPLPPTRPLSSSSQPARKPPPPPSVTILTNPARARPPPARKVQTTQPSPAPAPVTILTNPARARPPPAQKVQTTQPQSHSALAPKRAPASPAPFRARGSSVAAAVAKFETRDRTRPAASKPAAAKLADAVKGEHKRIQLLPEIVIHEPYSWDSWTDVHRPGTSYGKMLDVPAVNSCGKMHEDDVARYYPAEYSAEQTVKRLRSMVRSGRRLAAARRRERACQSMQASIAASNTDTPERSLAIRSRAAPPRSRFSP